MKIQFRNPYKNLIFESEILSSFHSPKNPFVNLKEKYLLLTVVGEGGGRGWVEIALITVRRPRHKIHGQPAVAAVDLGGWLGGVAGNLVVRSTDRGRGGRLKGVAVHNVLIWFLAIWLGSGWIGWSGGK